MSIYSVDFVIRATAFIQADNRAEAIEVAKDMSGEELEWHGDKIHDSLTDGKLPVFSFSPIVTVDKPNLRRVEKVDYAVDD